MRIRFVPMMIETTPYYTVESEQSMFFGWFSYWKYESLVKAAQKEKYLHEFRSIMPDLEVVPL